MPLAWCLDELVGPWARAGKNGPVGLSAKNLLFTRHIEEQIKIDRLPFLRRVPRWAYA
jgi:hypothetical protein